MDKETQRALRKFEQKAWHEDNQRAFMDFCDAHEWSITRFGHTFQGKPSGYMLITPTEPCLYLSFEEDGARIQIDAELSDFTRVNK